MSTTTAAVAAQLLADNGVDPNKKGPSQASQLVVLARERYWLFMSEDGRPYGIKTDGPNIALPLRGKAGLRSQLARVFTDTTGGTVPSQSALADAMTVLEGIAAMADPQVPQLRVARHHDRIIVDLGTTDGGCIAISPHGWQRLATSPVVFRRSGAMKPLPTPVSDGDGLAKLSHLMNTTEDGFHLLVAWMVAAFIPDLPHPILSFRGEQGTGKSKGAAMVIGIIDPSGAPKRTAPRDLKSWSVQAFNSWAICIDNVSQIADWLSDALCRAVTGDGVVDRALYSDDDVVVLEFRRVLAMTTIDAGALAGDLAERLLTIELQLIPDSKRREEAELDAVYAEAHPAILASLFDLLAKVLEALPDVCLTERPRMADFARVLAAVDHVTGWHTNRHLRLNRQRRRRRRPRRRTLRPGRHRTPARRRTRRAHPHRPRAPRSRPHPRKAPEEMAQGPHARRRPTQAPRPGPADRRHRGRRHPAPAQRQPLSPIPPDPSREKVRNSARSTRSTRNPC